jgi:DNA-binding CsgD family transcriptional regulator
LVVRCPTTQPNVFKEAVVPGLLQMIGISLPSSRGPQDRILAEVDRVQARGGVRVLDMILVGKDEDGAVVEASFGDDEDFGELISRIMPMGSRAKTNAGDAPAELWAQAQSMAAGTMAVFLLVEHRWADGILDAVSDAGGALLGVGVLTPELGAMIDAEIMAMGAAARSIDAAQAAEVDARLRAALAWAEADQAVVAASRIRSAAAAGALQALTDAGVVEATAAQEALDALVAAGLIIDAADNAAERAVEADASRVAAVDETSTEILAEDSADVAVADEKAADARVAASVTPAELRVMRYLPTQLTFALIGDKLGISRGAAKSRAERAYQKLGVHTRADAVQRAREFRLLP